MDRIDEWMKRAFEEEEKLPNSKPETKHPTPKDHKQGDFSKKQQRQPYNRPAQRPGQNRPAQNQRPAQSQRPAQNQRPAQSRPPRRQRGSAQNQNRPQPGQRSAIQLSTSRPPKKLPRKPSSGKPAQILKGQLKIIPLGGLNEVGKNMMVLEYEDDIMIIDMGLEFPSEDLLGIDYVIPDVSYLEENKKRIRGVVITHGHLDHTGGIPYILPKLDFPPVYASKLTAGLISRRLEEFKLTKMAKINALNLDQPLRLGKFLCRFIRVAHSIPDAIAVEVETPIGKIVHTGDFKFDKHPAGLQQKADIHKLEALGRQNVLALFSDSTNALEKGHTMSEEEVEKTLADVVKDTKGRIIVASFSSLIGRIQQIFDIAEKCDRKVFVSGRSMQENIKIASELGYLRHKPGLVQDIKKYKNETPDPKTLILTTGSQGESLSALTRIARGEHPHIKVKKGDTIIISASPIIGNERAIATVVNNLCILGATVIHNQIMDVHTSGHGKQEELKRMIQLVKPKFFIPIHGEYFMRSAHAELAMNQCGIPQSNIIMLENGDVLVAEQGKVAKSSEKVETKYILIDGRGEGHMGSQVQVDREIMSQNGALIILIHVDRKKHLKKTPDIVSRGFIYMHESEEIIREITEVAGQAYKNIMKKNPGATRQDVKKYIKQTVDKYATSKLERRPLIIPLIIES
ncbi:MAG: RNase J family beta-CASP ribonuclease [Candidatus Peregrinibacteria bacterium]